MTAPPPRTVWRRLGPARLAPEAAVARPIGLLDTAGAGDAPVASWSTVTRPTLVVGRTGRDLTLNDVFLRERGIDVTWRRSGGQPVLWDEGLLSLDVILPPGHPWNARDVTRAYEWLGQRITAALRELGVDAHTLPIHDARAHAARTDADAVRARRACYGGLSPFEVVAWDGRKLVGLSQARRRSGTLFQCGILLRWDPDTLAAALEPDPSEQTRVATALGAAATDLATLAPAIGADDVIGSVDRALGIAP